tara:strand:+ start:56 stop:358 length:303 start_codon:yes stop_codon:yes gene_type:complete
MLIAPTTVCGFRPFIEFVVGIRKYKPNVNIWVLLTDQLVLLAIFQVKDAFRFDIKKAAFLWQLKVRSILSVSHGDFVGNLVSLIDYFMPCGRDLFTNFVF